MNVIAFTIAIPSYNGANRLPKLLDCLRSQIRTEEFTWEIIVIDNNSQDNTAEVIRQYQTDWPSSYPLHYHFESQQGLAFARQRAIDEAKGTWVGFLDDDNLPAPDWVAEAYNFAQSYPKSGAFGGQIHGSFETQPPENFHRIASFLAIRERGAKPHLYKADQLSLPPGAGLVVRKQAWCENVPRRLQLIGRVNGSTLAGEDFETLLYLHQGGWEIWYCPTLHSYHQIPKERLEQASLLSLIRGCGLCICHLRLLNASPREKPIAIARILVGNLRRIVRHLLQYRGLVKTDLIAACELEFFLSSFLSPFYYLQSQFSHK
ncbi:hormogonium polysaccharide biosynthesis glycosyltransferase HpsE [Laspinema olomoucense]|uniref:hormogonium polysaccharide biosynthesis glycosyltransferase HpsE n=1 Tax=Laspinema olomoucense TaxID=3231600 RepID=UPI0021BA7631|nr:MULTISPECIES: hormogonium polysaccharide biosynthesis glycosyltransferase HpsE [unclassified Laspinema]MCT7972574.1 hormogonium polysaccharide biosynthesis glycosyltransferase HpsE [Laspinema sp. D3d]MCT7988731.1 hormogonium polysaccharide biosynthesis glycosyltransferase HpsE [Laspinema sp. D3a]